MPEFCDVFCQHQRCAPRRSGVWVGADFCSQYEAAAHAPDRLTTVVQHTGILLSVSLAVSGRRGEGQASDLILRAEIGRLPDPLLALSGGA